MELQNKPYKVYEDSRGSILQYDICGAKFNVLFTKAGALRSGDLHPVAQFDVVLDGEAELTTRLGNRDVVRKLKKNEFASIPPNVPHLFRFLKDTVMIEWWDGPFQAEYYKPYRDLVEKQLKK
jgi:mannose-6-phosphate isomerase-like protein (cupin superfamily)